MKPANFLLSELSKPAMRVLNLPVDINRYYTDVNGTMVDKALVPAALQVKYPLYLFCAFDLQGAYSVNARINPPVDTTPFLCTFIYGVQNPFFFGFSGLSDIQTVLRPGDIVSIFTDSILAPTFYVWIVQHTSEVALGSVVMNTITPLQPTTGSEYIEVKEIHYFTDNVYQWAQPMKIIDIKNRIGDYRKDNANILPNKYPKQISEEFIRVPLAFTITQYLGLSTYLLFATDSLQLNFIIKLPKQN